MSIHAPRARRIDWARPAPTAGDIIAAHRTTGRYIVHRTIGRGRFSNVHLGSWIKDSGVSHVVAIKRMLPEARVTPACVAMFQRESQLLSRIRHPNVVAFHDLVNDSSEVWLVMDYVLGVTLGELVSVARARRCRIPSEVGTAIMLDVLNGLHAVHTARAVDGTPLRAVHCDLSPNNVIIGYDGTAKLLDFGLSSSALGSPAHERIIMGTPRFMSPEQVLRFPVDARSDIYSATVLYWELLTGHAAYSDSNGLVETLRNVLHTRLPDVTKLAPDLAPALGRVVQRGVAKNRGTRYESVREMASAIQKASAKSESSDVCDWVHYLLSDRLFERQAWVADLERRAHAISSTANSEVAQRLRAG